MLLLAPRHPQRFGEVAELLAAATRPWVRLSAWQGQSIAAGTVLLLDSVGELAALYALASVAIVGGGFLHGGGHNPLEPAMLTRPVVIGPGYANFADMVSRLVDAKAVAVADLLELNEVVTGLLEHPDEAAAMGARAELVCRMQAGATGRAVRAIAKLVGA